MQRSSKGNRGASQMIQSAKNPPAKQEMLVWSLGGEDPLREKIAIHSSFLAWRFPWTEDPMRSQRVGHD